MASNLMIQNHQSKDKMVKSFIVRNPRNSCNNQFPDHCSTQLLIQNHSNFKGSGLPSRFMFYHDGSWLNFPNHVFEILRLGFLEKKPVVELKIDGSDYLFDFYRMLQIDFNSGCQRSISWIDENGKCFFPKVFVCDENAKIEIEITVDRKRKREVRDEVEEEEEENEVNSKVPCVISNKKALSEGDSGYMLVSNFFLSSMVKIDPGCSIVAIHQCMRLGPLEKARFDVFQKQNEITAATRGVSNMVYGWYGASVKTLDGILTHGFGEPVLLPGSSDTHGVGVYLSPVGLPHLCSAISEADSDGVKRMILCRVILGNIEEVEAGSRQSRPSSTKFDTGVDDLRCPKRYIIWCSNMNRHILPEYVVSFKSANHFPGQPRESTDTKYSLVKLLSKMKNSLPNSKVQEVAALFQTFKAGKLAKDVLVKRLRSIAGDEVLLSMIREIRGCE